jgi:flagellar hook-basal body complex protein FliE
MKIDPGIDGMQILKDRAPGVSGAELPGFQSPSSSGNKEVTFAGILENSLEKVNQAQSQADTAIKELIAGRSKNIHETLLTIERADASLKLAMQVRNKILDAYREVMRMQV